MAEASLARIAPALLASLMLLAGCADTAKREEDDLKTILAWLPGEYSTAPQSSQSGQIALAIVRIYTPQLGHHANVYAQEMAADAPNRVMTERVLSFNIVGGKLGIVSTVYTFNDPLQWRNGQRQPIIFNALRKEDVQSTPGCELVWSRSGEEFTARYDPTLCHSIPGAAAGGAPVYRLTAETFTSGDYLFRKVH